MSSHPYIERLDKLRPRPKCRSKAWVDEDYSAEVECSRPPIRVRRLPFKTKQFFKGIIIRDCTWILAPSSTEQEKSNA